MIVVEQQLSITNKQSSSKQARIRVLITTEANIFIFLKKDNN